MLKTDYIKFNEHRNLKELFKVTLAFFRQEFKYLFKSILILVIPLLFILGVISGIFQTEYLSLNILAYEVENFGLEYFEKIFVEYSLIISIFWIAASVIAALVLGYITEYIHNGAHVPIENVIAQVKAFLPRILLLNVVFFLLVLIGSIFFILPGIYFFIVLSISPVILVFEEASILTSFKRSMYFVKSYWWQSFVYIFLIGIIYYLISIIFSIPNILVTIFYDNSTFFAELDSTTLLVILIFSNIIQSLSFLFLSIVIIFISLYYFSQYQIKEAGKIQKLNESEQNK